MNRVHKSQVREILIQITDLKNKLNETYWKADLTARETVSIKKALAELNSTVSDLMEVV